jgi:hypothetical protein
MSHIYRGPNAAARDAIANILDKAWLYPSRGVHHGRGPHVPMPESWNGVGPVPIGWTSFQAHRNDGNDFIWLPEPETATKLARLTPGEQAQLAAARAAAEEHDPGG